MKMLHIVITLTLGLGAPAFADGFGGFDLPRLTFPTDATAPVTEGIVHPVSLVPGN